MKVCLAYHHVPCLPVEPSSTKLASDRFYRTYKEFPPGYPHELIWNLHDSPGRDIAAHQAIAPYLDCDFAVFMSARVFFKREGWLMRLMEVRRLCGEGVYGIMASNEACPLYPEQKSNPHMRTCLFGCNPKDMSRHDQVKSVEQSFEFESGGGINNVAKWQTFLVGWDGIYDKATWRKMPNGFRSGDQSNLLAHDRHSLAFDLATPEQKVMLTRIADGETIE